MSGREGHLSTGEAAERMGLSPDTVRGLCDAKVLKDTHRDSSNEWRIPESSVEIWMCKNRPRNAVEKLRGLWYRIWDHPRLVIPLAVLTVLFAVFGPISDAIGVLSFVEDRLRPLPVMTGDRNVAIAPFQVVGRGDGADSAQEMAINIANAIETELELVGQELGQKFEVRRPSELKVVKGSTEQNRAENARALAEEIRAHVVIYGVIELDDAAATIRPEFYVHDREFDEASEISGQYRMGYPIKIDNIASSSRRGRVADQIEARMHVLAYVMYGVSDYLSGEYADAIAKFRHALTFGADRSQDVLNVLLGNALLEQKRYQESERSFRTALEFNPVFSRAYVGLGSALLGRAAGDVNTNDYDTVNLELLEEAIGSYRRAMAPQIEQPPLAFVPIKATLALGQAFLLQSQVLRDRDLAVESEEAQDIAVEAFTETINSYGAEKDERIQELVADAHAHLGLVYWLEGHHKLAIEEYIEAITVLPQRDRNNEKRAQYQAAVGNIYRDLDQPVAAAEWYRRALDDAPSDWLQANQYQQILEGIQ